MWTKQSKRTSQISNTVWYWVDGCGWIAAEQRKNDMALLAGLLCVIASFAPRGSWSLEWAPRKPFAVQIAQHYDSDPRWYYAIVHRQLPCGMLRRMWLFFVLTHQKTENQPTLHVSWRIDSEVSAGASFLVNGRPEASSFTKAQASSRQNWGTMWQRKASAWSLLGTPATVLICWNVALETLMHDLQSHTITSPGSALACSWTWELLKRWIRTQNHFAYQILGMIGQKFDDELRLGGGILLQSLWWVLLGGLQEFLPWHMLHFDLTIWLDSGGLMRFLQANPWTLSNCIQHAIGLDKD